MSTKRNLATAIVLMLSPSLAHAQYYVPSSVYRYVPPVAYRYLAPPATYRYYYGPPVAYYGGYLPYYSGNPTKRFWSRQDRIELRRNRFFLVDQSSNGTFLSIRGKGEVMLRRDEIALESSGLISLGTPTAEVPHLCLQFTVHSRS